MKFPQLNLMNRSLATRMLVLLVCVAAVAISTSAQKTWPSSQKTWLSTQKALAPEAIGVDIEQCANGPFSAPINCNISTANDGYTRGNLIASKSHYLEGDSVPIRIVATDLVIGQSYTVTIGYDYTKGGKYATDYLTDYDRTESVNNDPCVGVTGCTLASETTFSIPIDSQVTAGFDGMLGTADDIVQIPGSFSCFGCTITGVSGYTLTGSTAGDSSKAITITFTANATNVVIAYGSHISTRTDWGINNSAISISGSPYHNFIVDFPGANQGNRDLQLSADAVVFPAQVTIIKSVTTLDPPLGSTSTFVFGFTSSANLGTTMFNLVDNVVGTGGGGTASQSFSGLVLFGAANAITVTEGNYSPTWTLSGINCVETPGGLPNTMNTTTSLITRTATIVLEEGEFVTCTFSNTQLQPTAAPASVSGRITDSFGTGIGGARLTLVDAQSGNSFSALSNSFGYYTIEGAEAGNFYVMTVSHKRYTFADDTRSFTLNEDLAGMDFVANP
ncbi:MAG TPA: carboxypeptidase-like regulatory domain-containing protein [Pyrinomonadaceae bacterium]